MLEVNPGMTLDQLEANYGPRIIIGFVAGPATMEVVVEDMEVEE